MVYRNIEDEGIVVNQPSKYLGIHFGEIKKKKYFFQPVIDKVNIYIYIIN